MEQRSLGDWLRLQRKSKGWSQVELGKRLDVSQGRISRLERGLDELDTSLETALQELFGEAPPPPSARREASPEAAAPETPQPKKKAGAQKKAGKKKGSDVDPQAQLLKELWQAAVNLRGSIEAPDYKRYVLPIVFLRFLSIRFERRREELRNLVRQPESTYFSGGDADVIAEILADEDAYRAEGVFMVPEKATWDYLRSQAQADDIKQKLDDALELLENTYPRRLKGLLPRIYQRSNLSTSNVTGLINLFSRETFRADHGGLDMIGRVYEYFIGEFASSEGKRGGEYFTPESIVKVLVAMLEPTRGSVFDPCCGSGGMFVQSDAFARHSRDLTFYGMESKEFTYRLCRMNLFIHGLDGHIELGDSYLSDKFADFRADFVMANPPFNDGAKGDDGWGADQIDPKDPRLKWDEETTLPLAARNANTFWMLHFLHHLNDTGTAGFVMATGELSNSESARSAVRKALVDGGFVDCIVQLTGQLFANTQIPCSLWFLSKNRGGSGGFRARRDEILFIDGRRLGTLIPGSRKQKQLSEEEIERIASVYRTFRREGRPEDEAGFCAVASLDDVRGHGYALTPGRYVGSPELEEDDEPFEEKFARLSADLLAQFRRSEALQSKICNRLEKLDVAF